MAERTLQPEAPAWQAPRPDRSRPWPRGLALLLAAFLMLGSVYAVLTPLFLVAGTFFPIETLPGWAQFLAELNPLHHTVELVRHAAFGWEGWEDVASLVALAVFGVVMWRIAIRAMVRKLID